MVEKGFEDIIDEAVVKYTRKFWKILVNIFPSYTTKFWKKCGKILVGIFLLYVIWGIFDDLICGCEKERWLDGKDVPKIMESYCRWSNNL